MEDIKPEVAGAAWIEELTDSQCMEIFWLYLEPSDDFLQRHPPALLGRAMRVALREVLAWSSESGTGG